MNEFSLGINTVLLSIVYLIRLNRENKVLLTMKNVRNVLLAAVIITHKYCEEKSMSFRTLASFSNLEAKELIRLEALFCKLLDWNLVINESTYEAARASCFVSLTMRFGSANCQ
mmetsp:Transcript_18231/g.22156  ORF Transcript_18231/g.22156 Transcript_18231/m.22156 type:complete len:114 (+) Transcript_18231:2-343(+)